MSKPLLARIALVSLLVFSQTLYAGHSVVHDSGQADCKICLQASTGAALSSGDLEQVIPLHSPVRSRGHITPPASSEYPNAHPSRAPPTPQP